MEAAAPPAELGEPTSADPLVAQLHRAVQADQPRRVRRCLARGCRPDAVNAAGQTPLFCAAFGARRAAAAELLRRGADPNARCDAGYTAVHGACYAGRLRVLRRLLECGGDLRLHDLAGRRPADWARLQSDPLRRRRVLQLIETARLAALTPSGRDLLVERSNSFSAADEVDLAELARSVQSVGFGAVYYGGGEAGAGALAVLPLTSDRALEPDRGARGYPLGAYTEMAARLYLGAPVSVRRLVERPPPGAQRDLLIAELEAARRLHHPALLLLMAVCPSENLDAVTLVFERVPLGSLHHCRYARGLRMPPAAAAEILLQVCGALQFLHAARWLHCAVTSHAVQLLTPTHAKLGCLEHALHVSAGPARPQRRLLACRADGALYNWLAPEVLRDGVPTQVADTYSFCVLVWELMHDQVPWDGLDADEIGAQAAAGGRSLAISAELCPAILRDVLELGLRADPHQRDLQLDEVRFMLTNLRDGVQKSRSRPVAAAQTPQTYPATPTSRPATPASRPASRPATPASVGRRLKPPAPAPPSHVTPARLSRTLSPDALRPPAGRYPPPPRQARTLDLTPEPRSATAESTDPYTGLRRTSPADRHHVRSATWQTSPAGSWQEATAIKPASHRLTRHGSSCSLSRRQAAGGSGASPWPPAEWDADTPPAGRRGLASPQQHSASLDGQAPRPPRFSPSPPSVSSLGRLMAELDMDRLFPPLYGPAETRPAAASRPPSSAAAAAQPQTPSAAHTVQSNSPVAGPRPAAGRSLRPVPARSYGSAASRGADRGTRSLPRLAPLVSDGRGVSCTPRPGSGQAAVAAGRWRARQMESRTAADVTDRASQTAARVRTSGGGRAERTESSSCNGPSQQHSSCNGPVQQHSSSGPAPNSSSSSGGTGGPFQNSNGGPFQNSSGGNGGPFQNSSSSSGGAPFTNTVSNGPTRSSSSEPTRSSQGPNGSSVPGSNHVNSNHVVVSQASTEPAQGSAAQTTFSSEEQMVSYSKYNFVARREFFSGRGGGGTAHSQSDSALRLPQGVKLNSALLLRHGTPPPVETSSPPASRCVLLGQPRPFQRPAGSATICHVPYTSPGELRPTVTASDTTDAVLPAAPGRGQPAAVTSTPHRPAAGRPDPPAVSSLSSGTAGSATTGHRLNVTFRAEVLEFSAAPSPPEEALPSPPDSPGSVGSDDDRCYYDDDLASPDAPPPHLQLLVSEDPPPELPPSPPPYAACLDDGGRASPLSMELASSAADSELDALEDELAELADLDPLDAELQTPLAPLHVSESDDELELAMVAGGGGGTLGSPCITSSEATRSDGSRVRLFEVACERGFQTQVETRARQGGQCTVTCTNTDLADGTTETYRQTVSADQVQTQIVVADR